MTLNPFAYCRGAVFSGCLEAGEGDRTGDIQLGKRKIPPRNRALRTSIFASLCMKAQPMQTVHLLRLDARSVRNERVKNMVPMH
jgi:hypothetical protein